MWRRIELEDVETCPVAVGLSCAATTAGERSIPAAGTSTTDNGVDTRLAAAALGLLPGSSLAAINLIVVVIRLLMPPRISLGPPFTRTGYLHLSHPFLQEPQREPLTRPRRRSCFPALPPRPPLNPPLLQLRLNLLDIPLQLLGTLSGTPSTLFAEMLTT